MTRPSLLLVRRRAPGPARGPERGVMNDLRDLADHPAGHRWVDGVGLVECCYKRHPADHAYSERGVSGFGLRMIPCCSQPRDQHPTTTEPA